LFNELLQPAKLMVAIKQAAIIIVETIPEK